MTHCALVVYSTHGTVTDTSGNSEEGKMLTNYTCDALCISTHYNNHGSGKHAVVTLPSRDEAAAKIISTIVLFSNAPPSHSRL